MSVLVDRWCRLFFFFPRKIGFQKCREVFFLIASSIIIKKKKNRDRRTHRPGHSFLYCLSDMKERRSRVVTQDWRNPLFISDLLRLSGCNVLPSYGSQTTWRVWPHRHCLIGLVGVGGGFLYADGHFLFSNTRCGKLFFYFLSIFTFTVHQLACPSQVRLSVSRLLLIIFLRLC